MVFPLLIIFLALTASGLATFVEAALFSFDSEKWESEHGEGEEPESLTWLHEHSEQSAAFVRTIRSFATVTASMAALWLLISEFSLIGRTNIQIIMYMLVTALAVSFFFWIFALLVPKAIGEKTAQKAAPLYVLPFTLLLKIFQYPLRLVTLFSNFLLKPFKIRSSFLPLHTSEDKIRAMIDEGLKSGSIDESEHKILENVFEFNDLKANEVMVPRTEMVAVEMSHDIQSMLNAIVKTGHSLIPVYQESLDKIFGIIHIKSLMRSVVQNETPDIKSCIRPAYFVPETKMISEILGEMQQRGERICIVTDEYGGTEGVITLEDILSEIVGDFSDSDSPLQKEYINLPDGSFSILGSMEVDDFNEIFSIELPLSERYNTIAGFVAYYTGKILNPGEVFTYENIDFELIKKVKQRMVQFKINSEDSLLKDP